MKKTRGAILTAVALCLLSSTFLGMESGAQGQAEESWTFLGGPTPTTVTLGLGAEPLNLDPALAQEPDEIFVLEQLFVGLTTWDPDTGTVLPALAIHWETSADGLTWTFHLRRNVPWVRYNLRTEAVELAQTPWGTTRWVTAHDVEYGVKRSLNPETGSAYAYVLYAIKNGRAFNEGHEGVTIDDVGVRAVDDYTVEFILERSAGYFPAIVGLWVAHPQPAWAIEQYGARWVESGFIVTNGPYALAEWRHFSSLHLVKNPFWPDAGAVQIETVNLSIVETMDEALRLYRQGVLDTTGLALLDNLAPIHADPMLSRDLFIAPNPKACTYFYGFTTTKPPFDNPLVRRAFAAAVDRQQLVAGDPGGLHIPTTTLAPPGIFGAVPPGSGLGIAYDPEQARAWLAEAGYPDGQGFPEVILGYNASETHTRIAAAIKAMWEQTLHVPVRLATAEWQVYLQIIRKTTPVEDTFHVFRLGGCADYPDQHSLLFELFHATEGPNWVRRNCLDPNCGAITTSEFDHLLETASQALDPRRREQLYHQAEQILTVDEAAVLPLLLYTRPVLTRSHLQRTYASFGAPSIAAWRMLPRLETRHHLPLIVKENVVP